MKTKPTQNWLSIIQSYDEEFKFSDYSPQEIEEILKTYENADQNFKDRYFMFYDDIKSHTLKKQDW